MPFQLSLATLAMQSQQIKETCQKLCCTFTALFCLFSRFPSLLCYTELPSSLLLPCKTIHDMLRFHKKTYALVENLRPNQDPQVHCTCEEAQPYV